MEYGKLAQYYDGLYQNKDYSREVEFLRSIFPDNCASVLDLGCGTGEHLKLMQKYKYECSGIDISPEMIQIAKQKVVADLKVSDIYSYDTNKKFDVIISMFAVFNHLSSPEFFKDSLINIKRFLKPDGLIIIDLHNPQSDGKKRDSRNGIDRTMQWTVDRHNGLEFSKIEYQTGNDLFKTEHILRIYTTEQLQRIVLDSGLILVAFYKNYTKIPANNNSKNIQMVLSLPK